MSQCDDVLFRLKAGMELTRLSEMQRGIGNLPARIQELRDWGYDISTDMRQVRKANGNTATVAFYKLERNQPELF